MFSVCSIRIFVKFSGDPYYEPLTGFMIHIQTGINITCALLKMWCVRKTFKGVTARPEPIMPA